MRLAFATTLATACTALHTLQSVAAAQPLVPSPLVVSDQPSPDRPAHQPPIVTCRFDHEAYQTLEGLDALRLVGFPSPIGPLDLDLESFEILSATADVIVGAAQGDIAGDRPDVMLLRGSVAGVRDSQVFLGLSPLGTNGWINIGQTRFIVATTRASATAQRTTAVYDLDALPEGAIDWASFTCGTDELPPIQVGDVDTSAASPSAAPSRSGPDNPTCRTVKVAIDSDYEYTQSEPFFGDTAASKAYVYTLFGAISEIYRRDFDTILEITFVRVWATNSDPYSGSSANDRLNELRSWWQRNMGHIDRNNAHLLSGQGGGGVAWLGTLCSPSYGYAYSGVNGSFPYPLTHNHRQNWDVMVVSHEMGHSFGASHTHSLCPPIDQCPPSKYWGPCQTQQSCTNRGTIMSYCHLCSGGMTNIRVEFHPRTIDHVLPRLTSSGCLGGCDCYADCDQASGAGVLDIFDFLCFQDRFVGGEPYACDCDTTSGQGVCDIFDFLCFQDAFVAGCQ